MNHPPDERLAEPGQGVVWLVRLGEEFLEKQGEEEARMLDLLAEAWKGTFKSEFGTKTAEYYLSLEGPRRKDRAELRTRFAAIRSAARKVWPIATSPSIRR